MDLIAVPLSLAWVVAGWAAALPVLIWAWRTAPWPGLAASVRFHVVVAGILCVVVLWTLQATVGEGFTFHLLGVAAFTLAAGPQLALIGTLCAVLLQITLSGAAWANGGIAFMTMGAIPVVVVWSLVVFEHRRMPGNFFLYVFVCGFFGAGASLGAGGLVAALALAYGAGVKAALVFGEYVPYLLYLAMGEATLTGMAITLMVVYRPKWVATFDDERYLKGR